MNTEKVVAELQHAQQIILNQFPILDTTPVWVRNLEKSIENALGATEEQTA